MTTDQKRAILAILETLYEEREGGPESAIYLALGCDLELWYALKYALVQTDYIQEASHWVTITPKGIAAIEKIHAKQKAQVPA